MKKAFAAVMAGAVAATGALVGLGSPAHADEGTLEGIGARKGHKFEQRSLNDRMSANVNVATGNLLLDEKDLQIAGTGLSVTVSRYFNSLSTAASMLSPGWVMSVGHDVRLDVQDSRVVLHAPSGYLVTFTEGAAGFTAEAPGFDAELSRRADGGFELAWRSKEKWHFDASGTWTSQEDANGNTVSFEYVSNNDTAKQSVLSRITDTRGRAVTFTYSKGRLVSMSDEAGGRTYSYGYEKQTDRLSSFAVTAYALGSDNVNKNALTSFAYDTSGRLSSVTDPRGHSTTFAYAGTTRKVASMTRVMDESTGAGPTTRFTYSDQLDKCSDESEAVAETTVDGPRTDVQDVTTYCVDEHDRVVATVNAKGHKAGKKYTSNSNVTELNESGVAAGPSYQFKFEEQNDNLTGVSLPTGGEASLDYQDGANKHLPTAVKDFSAGPDAPATWAYDYDDNGNLIEAQNPLEDITYRYCYDADGNLTRVGQPDLDGLPLDEDLQGDSCAGHAQGDDTLMSYNADGELVRFDPPGAHRTQTFTYDALSRVKTMRDGRNVTQTFTYDSLDRVVQVYYQQPSTSGTMLSSKRLSSSAVAGPDGTNVVPDDEDAKQTWIKYSYDPNGNLLARSDSAGNSTFQYDPLNRMTKESPESPSSVVTYTYDPAGNVTTIATSDAPAPVRYTFDETNLTTSVAGPEGRTTRFEYDKNSNRTSTVYPNGVTMDAEYDDAGRMTCTYSYTGGSPGETGTCPAPSTDLITFFEYSYSTVLGGVPTDTNRREQVTGRAGDVTKYTYDGLGRLADATTTGAAGTVTRKHAYTYDDRSNLTQERVSGTQATAETRTQAYNSADELCWVAAGDHAADCAAAPAGARGVTYDPAGNMTGIDGGVQMAYSLRGHMVSVTPPGLDAVRMEYADATQDRRVEADGIRMSYSQLGLVQQAPTNASSKATWFVRDTQQRLVSRSHAEEAKADLFYLFDGLGSVAATTDAAGSVVERYEYEPFGEEIAPSEGDANPWRFASGYYDAKTGMVKFGTRYYMPDLARWTQPDPVWGKLSNPTTLNAYAYVGCNPTNYVDPSGRAVDWGDVAMECAESAVMDLGFSLAMGAVSGGTAAVGIALVGCIQGAGIEILAQEGQEELAAFLDGYFDGQQIAEILIYIARRL